MTVELPHSCNIIAHNVASSSKPRYFDAERWVDLWRGEGGATASDWNLNETSKCTILSKNVAQARDAVVRHERSTTLRHSSPINIVGLYAPDGARKYLNAHERARALAAIDSLKTPQALFALTLAWTGARVSEVLGLTPSSFQIEGSLVAIRTLKRRRHVVREVPLPPDLLAALTQHFQLAERQQDPSRANERLWPWCRQTAWRIIKELMCRAHLSGRAASPRGLRHGFGVGTLQAGVPITLTQRWLGHSRLSTTSIYTEACGPEEIAFAARYWDSCSSDL